MPRFHFDLHSDGVTIPDLKGVELSNVQAARAEATRAAAEMLRDRVEHDSVPADLRLVVRTEAGTPLFTVRVALKVEQI
jgi:hypothetical protein